MSLQMQCGDRCKAYIVERSPAVFLLSVHVKDLPMVRLEFEGDELTRHVGNPNIHSVVEYSAITGVSRSLAKGGAKYHQALLKAFAEHLLHVTVEARVKTCLLCSWLHLLKSWSLLKTWCGSLSYAAVFSMKSTCTAV